MDHSSDLVGSRPTRRRAGTLSCLPELSEPATRKLALQWDELVETHHFNGEHAGWHEEDRAHRRKIMAQTRRGVSWLGATYDPSYVDAVDDVGILQTVNLAGARFDQLRSAYLPLWAASQDARVEEFSAWLSQMAATVAADVASLWESKSQWHSEWFHRECRKKLVDELSELVRKEIGRIRRLAIKHLENSHLPLSEIIAADGDLSFASIIQQGRKAIENAERALSLTGLPEPQAAEINSSTVFAVQNLESNASNVPAPPSRLNWKGSGGKGAPQRTVREKSTAATAGNGAKANWADIEISFTSDERVQIRNGRGSETRNYDELGFRDARSGKPNQAWVAFRAMAEQDGIIRNGAKTGQSWPKVERRVQEIRKALRSHFGITSDPVPFVKGGTGYRALFKIRCAPSFRS